MLLTSLYHVFLICKITIVTVPSWQDNYEKRFAMRLKQWLALLWRRGGEKTERSVYTYVYTHTHTHCNNPDNVQHVAELRISSNCILMWLRRLSICLQCRRHRFNPWVGKISWRRKWQPTLVFLPGKSMDRGAWRATVHGVAKSQTQLSD